MTSIDSRSTRTVPKPPLRSHLALSIYPPNLLLVRLLLHVLMLVLVLLVLAFSSGLS